MDHCNSLLATPFTINTEPLTSSKWTCADNRGRMVCITKSSGSYQSAADCNTQCSPPVPAPTKVFRTKTFVFRNSQTSTSDIINSLLQWTNTTNLAQAIQKYYFEGHFKNNRQYPSMETFIRKASYGRWTFPQSNNTVHPEELYLNKTPDFAHADYVNIVKRIAQYVDSQYDAFIFIHLDRKFKTSGVVQHGGVTFLGINDTHSIGSTILHEYCHDANKGREAFGGHAAKTRGPRTDGGDGDDFDEYGDLSCIMGLGNYMFNAVAAYHFKFITPLAVIQESGTNTFVIPPLWDVGVKNFVLFDDINRANQYYFSYLGPTENPDANELELGDQYMNKVLVHSYLPGAPMFQPNSYLSALLAPSESFSEDRPYYVASFTVRFDRVSGRNAVITLTIRKKYERT